MLIVLKAPVPEMVTVRPVSHAPTRVTPFCAEVPFAGDVTVTAGATVSRNQVPVIVVTLFARSVCVNV